MINAQIINQQAKKEEKMKRLFKRFHSRQGGFTLVELLVVIAIVGILTAIIIPSVAHYMNSGQTAANETERSLVQNAIFAAMASSTASTVNQGTVSATVDPTFSHGSKSAKISDYFSGNMTTLLGTYSFGTDGKINNATYP
jgi:prepilin-type N-terminal cleavage/methylation domain-containing protein